MRFRQRRLPYRTADFRDTLGEIWGGRDSDRREEKRKCCRFHSFQLGARNAARIRVLVELPTRNASSLNRSKGITTMAVREPMAALWWPVVLGLGEARW